MQVSSNYAGLTYKPVGDKAIVVQFEDIVSITVNRRVHALSQLIQQSQILGVEQLIPAMNTLTIYYDPLIIDYPRLLNHLRGAQSNISENMISLSKEVYLPVVFGGEYGMDLEDVSKQTGLSQQEVVNILLSKPYLVYMVGFTAGFPYCGDLDGRLKLQRLSNPRLMVQKGSIAIANEQTGIYTITSPGGWHIVGWTPMETFNPYREPPSLLLAGDYVQYVQIGEEQAKEWNERRQREWDREWNS